MMYTTIPDGTFGADMGVDPEAFKAVMSQWPSGVTVVTTRDADGPHGMTASSFSSVSLHPPLVSVCVARHLQSHDRIAGIGVFAVNILDKDQVDLGLRFAGMLEGVEDRFAGITTTTAATGAPLLDGTLGWVDCRVWQAYDGGDHTIFVGQVLAASSDAGTAPLLYHSRSWGQFADVLATEVTVTTVEDDDRDAVVVEAAFGTGPDAPTDIDAIVARVDTHLVDHPALLVLDDTPNAADPVQLRQVLQALSGHVGRTCIALRAGTGPMALANVLVALKSGVHDLQASTAGAAVPLDDLSAMLNRMGVIMRTPTHT